MSTTYIAVVVTLLANILPLMGIDVGGEALTTTAQTLVTVVAGIWILIQRYSKGDVTTLGFRK